MNVEPIVLVDWVFAVVLARDQAPQNPSGAGGIVVHRAEQLAIGGAAVRLGSRNAELLQEDRLAEFPRAVRIRQQVRIVGNQVR